MALWAAHEWTFDVYTKVQDVNQGKRPDWQASDVSAEEMYRQWQDRFDEILAG